MAVEVNNMVLESSHKQIKITTKLQHNHHSKLLAIKLDKSPTTKDKKKSHIGTGRKHRKGWSHTPMWWIKIRRDILAAEVLPRNKESQPHTRPPNPGVQCQEEKSP